MCGYCRYLWTMRGCQARVRFHPRFRRFATSRAHLLEPVWTSDPTWAGYSMQSEIRHGTRIFEQSAPLLAVTELADQHRYEYVVVSYLLAVAPLRRSSRSSRCSASQFS